MSKPNAAAALREGQLTAAKQITLFRLFWLFLLSSFLGDLIEVAFWALTRGELVSRSSLLWGPFSLVWGLGPPPAADPKQPGAVRRRFPAGGRL